MASRREFDIVIHKTSGFTKQLVAEYMAARHGASGLRWALSGRNADKLAKVRDAVGAPADTPILIADAADPAAVVLDRIGEALVAACAATGTD